MQSVDVNVLLYAFDADSPWHERARRVLDRPLQVGEPLGMLPAVLTGFVRVVTDRRILRQPARPDQAREFLASLLGRPLTRVIPSEDRWWGIFSALVAKYQPRGADTSDVALAASALEHGVTWVSFDRGFARFTELRWVNPAD